MFGMALLVCVAFAGVKAIHAEEVMTIAEGVYIGSVDVGGMTYEQATEAVNEYIAQAGNARSHCQQERRVSR